MTQIIGITGGIASGKSTVVGFIREAGYEVIDADQVVRDLQEKGGRLYHVLLETFGHGILKASGDLDRKKLSDLIFSNPDHMVKSSQVQNQIIKEELAIRRDCVSKSHSVFFMDIPLLIELGYQNWFDAIWLVCTDEKKQLSRLMTRDQLSLKEAKQRTASQLPMIEKKSYAHLIINNNGNLESLKEHVQQALSSLVREGE
ncbi:dephospho-CoA kinase [Streptococcus castoreus]|uniref:dephospho-CoA kinase n=1 Tax=Streptococcus castoreus TaxID=254786 RepID=UPI0004238E92|nr:dephospho-CoA kinase [Streptococcus castoreus]